MKNCPDTFMKMPSRPVVVAWTVAALLIVAVPWWVGVLHLFGAV